MRRNVAHPAQASRAADVETICAANRAADPLARMRLPDEIQALHRFLLQIIVNRRKKKKACALHRRRQRVPI
ncbi:MAG TPA: hypothetical protein DEP35_09255 [Deltaproteobacteria bacterium]|jgi:hypothetical protein|nr:hypothetical protein [Deltaproteobacteria bacterium]